MVKPSAVVFDNDGLLLDTEEAWTRAELTLFARRGRAFTQEHKRTLIGSSRSLAAVKLEALLQAPGEGEALMDELHELVMEEALQGVAPRPGALALLARLSEAGMPMAVASNSEREFLVRTLASAGLLRDGPFATVVSATEVAQPKARARHLPRGLPAPGRRSDRGRGARGFADRRGLRTSTRPSLRSVRQGGGRLHR